MMEYLNRLLCRLQLEPSFKYHGKCKALGLTHLAFADDVLIFSRGDTASVGSLLKVLQAFSASTGLIINPRKCGFSLVVWMKELGSKSKNKLLFRREDYP